jgi:hypothetical protein
VLAPTAPNERARLTWSTLQDEIQRFFFNSMVEALARHECDPRHLLRWVQRYTFPILDLATSHSQFSMTSSARANGESGTSMPSIHD